MLPKSRRITDKAEFQNVLKKGAMLHSRLLSVSCLSSEGTSRFGIIVSNKVSKKAVARNRIRRIIRAAIHESLDVIPDNRLFVYLVKPSAESATDQDLRDTTLYLLNNHAKRIR